MRDINSACGTGVDDAIQVSGVRELCHDLLESAAAIGLLAQAAAAEADPAVAAGSQLSGQLRLIAAAAGQVVATCTNVLDQCTPPAAHVHTSPRGPGMLTSPRMTRHEGGRRR